jgi:hypothetical protein
MRLFELINPIDIEKVDDSEAGVGHIEQYDADKIKDVLDFISTHCSDAIKVFQQTGFFLYRGINSAGKIFIATTPINRRPQGQTPATQKILDNIFKLVGFKSLRSTSISVTPTIWTARQWGSPYYIFPLNSFSYTWSEKVKDIGGDYELHQALLNFAPSGDNYENRAILKLSYENATEFIDQWKFHNNYIEAALIRNQEISIHGQYVAISYNNFAPLIDAKFKRK